MATTKFRCEACDNEYPISNMFRKGWEQFVELCKECVIDGEE